MAGRGRKDGARHPCGKLVQAPLSPPDLIEKRRILVGDDVTNELASYPLGILRMRGLLTPIDHAAGLRYAGLYASIFGRGAIKSHLESVIYGLRGGLKVVDEAFEARQRQLADDLGRATAVLTGLQTQRPYRILCNIAIYEHPLRFMDLTRARTPAAWQADQRDVEALQEATDALAKHWKMGEYRPASAAN